MGAGVGDGEGGHINTATKCAHHHAPSIQTYNIVHYDWLTISWTIQVLASTSNSYFLLASNVGSLPIIVPLNVMLGEDQAINIPCAQPFDEGETKLYVVTADDTLYIVLAANAEPEVGKEVALFNLTTAILLST